MTVENTFKDMRKYIDIDVISISTLPIFKKLMINEHRLDFFNYIFQSKLISKKPDTVVLSSIYNYFYADEEIRKARVIVNLQELNKIPDLTAFLDKMAKLPPKSVFCGCFIDNKKIMKKVSFKYTKLLDAIRLLLEAGNRYLSRYEVASFFTSHNFKIIDMQTINGITYFYAKKQ